MRWVARLLAALALVLSQPAPAAASPPSLPQLREAFMAAVSEPQVMAEIVADEETLFDRERNRFFLVEERESELGGGGGRGPGCEGRYCRDHHRRVGAVSGGAL